MKKIKVVTPQEMEHLDANTIRMGVNSLDLMENAGKKCTEEIEKEATKDDKILVFCGMGNNGGDGQVIARLLIEKGYSVSVVFIGDEANFTAESKANFKRLIKVNVPYIFLNEDTAKEFTIKEATIIIDAMFGNGLKDRPLTQWLLRLIKTINRHPSLKIAIDIPSGLRGDNGLAQGEAVLCDKTLVLQCYKAGLLLSDGPDYVGKLVLLDIGIDDETGPAHMFYLQKKDLIYPVKRKKNSHKYDYGSVVVIAGSPGMIGAGILSMKGALRAGAGLVTAYVPKEVYASAVVRAPVEVMVKNYEQNITVEHLESDKKRVILIGPGIGRLRNYGMILHDFLERETPLIIDADGLHHLKHELRSLKTSKTPTVLTPHYGEFSKLIEIDKATILKDPLTYGRNFAMEYGVILVLKGYHSAIFSPDGDVCFNTTGNPGMATAGSGDVLAGIIAGLAGQYENLLEAVKAGVFYHGAAGDIYSEKYGESTLTAGDIIDSLKYVLN